MHHLANILHLQLEEQEKSLKASIAIIKKMKAQLEKKRDGVFSFRITLHSMWANEGEKSVIISHRGTLKAALKEACERFKRINNRSDVQAHCDVYAFISSSPKGTIRIDEDLWRAHFKEFGEYKPQK